MNDKLKEFLLGIGAMTELWMVTYNSFRQQGLSHAESLEHTSAFTKTLYAQLMGNVNTDKQ